MNTNSKPTKLPKPPKTPKTPKPRKNPFPDRVVLGEGFPWATGLGTEADPYDTVALIKGRIGYRPIQLDFPKTLWSRKVPQYRLVLEKVKPSKPSKPSKPTKDTP